MVHWRNVHSGPFRQIRGPAIFWHFYLFCLTPLTPIPCSKSQTTGSLFWLCLRAAKHVQLWDTLKMEKLLGIKVRGVFCMGFINSLIQIFHFSSSHPLKHWVLMQVFLAIALCHVWKCLSNLHTPECFCHQPLLYLPTIYEAYVCHHWNTTDSLPPSLSMDRSSPVNSDWPWKLNTFGTDLRPNFSSPDRTGLHFKSLLWNLGRWVGR